MPNVHCAMGVWSRIRLLTWKGIQVSDHHNRRLCFIEVYWAFSFFFLCNIQCRREDFSLGIHGFFLLVFLSHYLYLDTCTVSKLSTSSVIWCSLMKSIFVIAPDEHFQGFYTNVPPSSHASSSPCLFSGLYSGTLAGFYCFGREIWHALSLHYPLHAKLMRREV